MKFTESIDIPFMKDQIESDFVSAKNKARKTSGEIVGAFVKLEFFRLRLFSVKCSPL